MALWRRLLHLRRASTFDRELDEEIAAHIEMRAEELQQEGMGRVDALARARREFGSELRVKEDTRAAWQLRWLEETIADLLWHNRRGMTAHYSTAQIVEIRDALELITDERNRFNKSLSMLVREKSPQKVPTPKTKRART